MDKADEHPQLLVYVVGAEIVAGKTGVFLDFRQTMRFARFGCPVDAIRKLASCSLIGRWLDFATLHTVRPAIS